MRLKTCSVRKSWRNFWRRRHVAPVGDWRMFLLDYMNTLWLELVRSLIYIYILYVYHDVENADVRMDGDGVDLVLWWWCSGFRGFRGFRSLQEMRQELRMYIYSVDFHCDKRRRDMTSGYVMGRGGELWQLIGDDLNRPMPDMPGRRARIAVTWWSGISMTAPDHHRCGLLGVPWCAIKIHKGHEKTWEVP